MRSGSLGGSDDAAAPIELAVLLKRSFRPRMNMKTGKAYADAMTCRFRLSPGSEPEDVPVFDENGYPYEGELESSPSSSISERSSMQVVEPLGKPGSELLKYFRMTASASLLAGVKEKEPPSQRPPMIMVQGVRQWS